MRPGSVVVGVNGSPEAVAATKWAAAEATRIGTSLTIVSSYSTASYNATAMDGGLAMADDESLKQGAIEITEQALAAIADFPLEVETEIRLGDPATVLVEMSEQANLLVIASHGGGGLTDRLLGAVSATVPARAHCPVVLVPTHESGKPFVPVERIVVGVDGSDVASSALIRAVDEAIAWNASLTVVSAVPIATGGGAMSWLPVAVDRKALMDDVLAGLDVAITQALAGRDYPVARHALDGNPAGLLAEFSTAVDLVIMGTRGRGGFAGMLLGSTSQTVLAHSTCPVMTVPSKHRDRRPNPTAAWERR